MSRKLSVTLYLSVVFIFLLLSYDFYLSKKYYPVSSDEFLSNPQKHGGKTSEFAGPVINISDSSFYMSVNQKPIKVYYSRLEKPKFGQLYVSAKLNPDSTATAIEVHNLSYNYLKYFISLIGFVIFLIIFFREWKFRKWRFVGKNA